MRGGKKIDLTWSACRTHTSVHVAHQFMVYHTSILHSQSLQSLVLRGSVHMYVCTCARR